MQGSGFLRFFTRRLAFFLFLGLVFSNITFFMLVGGPLGDSYSNAFHQLQDINENLLTTILSITGYILLLIIPLIFFASVLMSHRVSGPVFRFERSAESLANGDLTVRVRLRDKDEMKDVAARMDGTIDDFRNRITGLKQRSRRINEYIDHLPKALSGGASAEAGLAGTMERIVQECDGLRADISQFKL